MPRHFQLLVMGLVGLSLLATTSVRAQTTQPTSRFGRMPAKPLPGDHLLKRYFIERTEQIATACMADIEDADDWQRQRDASRRQLAEMLGLWPEPERTDLHAVATPAAEHPDFTVENVHFQSMPGLYVTANLYVPRQRVGKLPTIVYVCGHGQAVDGGVSYGNKTSYQHHPAWFARNGYVCLVLDTVQLGEIQGVHHGTNRLGMWWWSSRGYTPAGVEAWSAIRALDYLQTRPEVDVYRFGITGRSGGGAYTWWAAALDERFKVAVPVAGITDLQNHIVDGCIEGHCDCMYMVNTYRWDFAKVAALVSPRPLLIANSDKDDIFPLDGVSRVHDAVRRIYRLQKAGDKLGLLITEGPHQDTQDLQVPALRWFNRWLKDDRGVVPNAAEKFFDRKQLKVFQTLPKDERNTTIQASFTPKAATPAVPDDAAAWQVQKREWMDELSRQSFAAWPAETAAPPVRELFAAEKERIRLRGYEFASQPNVPIRLYIASGAQTDDRPDLLVLNVVDESTWSGELSALKSAFAQELADLSLPDPANAEDAAATLRMLKNTKWAMAYVAVRGVGPSAWSGDAKRLNHLRRSFLLLGETLDGMRVWDVCQATRVLKNLDPWKNAPLWLQGERRMAGVALFAAIFQPNVARLDLHDLEPTFDQSKVGPEFLNVLKVLDMPAAVAMAAETTQVRLYPPAGQPATTWSYPVAVASKLGWKDGQVQIREAHAD